MKPEVLLLLYLAEALHSGILLKGRDSRRIHGGRKCAEDSHCQVKMQLLRLLPSRQPACLPALSTVKLQSSSQSIPAEQRSRRRLPKEAPAPS